MASDGMFGRHVARLRSSLSAHSHETICDFITEHFLVNSGHRRMAARGEQLSKMRRLYLTINPAVSRWS